MHSIRKMILLSALAIALSGRALADIPREAIQKLKRSVVNIEAACQVALNCEQTGNWIGTGFIVDKAKGLIATNSHVAMTSPARHSVRIFGGVTADARRLYSDPTHDFALLKVDPADIPAEASEVEFGDSFALKEGDEVFMVGNSEGSAYTVKTGFVTALSLNRGDRHSATIRTSFDRNKGSSGAPVADASAKVVAIHFKGSDTTSWELRVEYLKDALKEVQTSGKVKRGECGMALDLISVDDAVKHYKLPPETARKIKSLEEYIRQTICVESSIPGTAAQAAGLEPGDIVLEINGQAIGDNLYLADKLVNEALEKGSVEVTVMRAGKEIKANLGIEDAQTQKVRTFALYAGGVFQSLTPELRRRFGFTAQDHGAFLVFAKNGATFSGLGNSLEEGGESYAILVSALDGHPTRDLESFMKVAGGLPERCKTNMMIKDGKSASGGSRSVMITVDPTFGALQIFDWSDQKLEWVERKGK